MCGCQDKNKVYQMTFHTTFSYIYFIFNKNVKLNLRLNLSF